MPLSPEWANLPKRHCDDCGKLYKPVKPLREGERGFCCANCRKSYHKHGGAYRKLKHEMEKLVAKKMGELEKRVREIMRAELKSLVDSLTLYSRDDQREWQMAIARAELLEVGPFPPSKPAEQRASR
jgi:recombinational DNA repair protein (RecF pathway)